VFLLNLTAFEAMWKQFQSLVFGFILVF